MKIIVEFEEAEAIYLSAAADKIMTSLDSGGPIDLSNPLWYSIMAMLDKKIINAIVEQVPIEVVRTYRKYH